MLVLKELRLANDSKVATNTALLATASSCSNGACKFGSNTKVGSDPGFPGGGGGSSSRGGNGGSGNRSNRRGGNRECNSNQAQQQQPNGVGYGARPRPDGLWVCYPWFAPQAGS
jgi:hypothetical protein